MVKKKTCICLSNNEKAILEGALLDYRNEQYDKGKKVNSSIADKLYNRFRKAYK